MLQLSTHVATLALALSAYRADHGGYPSELGKLVPAYLPKLPENGVSDAGFRYRLQGTGYVLDSTPERDDDPLNVYPVVNTAAVPVFSLRRPQPAAKDQPAMP